MRAKKRTSLDAVFGIEELPVSISMQERGASSQSAMPMETAQPAALERAGAPKRPRVKQHTAYLPHPVHEQLRRLAFEENRKIHDYFLEGLDRVFADRGLPSVKDIS